MIIKLNEKKHEIVGKIKMKKNKKNNESRNIKAKNNRYNCYRQIEKCIDR